MTKTPNTNPVPRERTKALRRWNAAAVIALLIGLLLLTLPAMYYYWYPSQIGPAQPISFSHRIHVKEKHLSCLMCHGGTVDTPRAGVPPVETCMLCHQRIIVTHPQIVKLTDYWRRKEPVPWVRVNDVPEFVYFNHQVHIRKGFDCGRCHGDVSGMDRVAMPLELDMGVCVQCHRDQNYSHDCYVCHR